MIGLMDSKLFARLLRLVLLKKREKTGKPGGSTVMSWAEYLVPGHKSLFETLKGAAEKGSVPESVRREPPSCQDANSSIITVDVPACLSLPLLIYSLNSH